jgi:hypothetical protein
MAGTAMGRGVGWLAVDLLRAPDSSVLVAQIAQEAHMQLLLILLVLFLLFGGGGGWYAVHAGADMGTVLIVLVVVFVLFGGYGWRAWPRGPGGD